jgi:CRP-like cAMP-binding protein
MLKAALNDLIERLPGSERKRVLDNCDAVDLVFGDVLCEPGTRTAHVYFPTASFISLVAKVDAHPGLEVGMVGREGMVGAQLVLGVAVSPLRALVQGAGHAWRMAAEGFQSTLARSPALRLELNRYLFVLLAQTASSAGCLHFHQIGPRLARWLLLTQDRADGDSFQVTHEFLAFMLGVRRVGVTVAAGDLQRRGLISYRRGRVQVLDRPGLESAACSCYANERAAYQQQFGAGRSEDTPSELAA